MKTNEIELRILDLAASVVDGQVDPLEALAALKKAEKALKISLDAIKEPVLREYDRKGGRPLEAHECRFERAETGVTYEYNDTGDREWFQWQCTANAALDRQKEREKWLRALKTKIFVTDEQTGEMYYIEPPIKKSTTVIKTIIK